MDETTRPYRAVDVRLSQDEYSVTLGEQVIVRFSVTNRGDQEDYFDISVQGIPSAWLVLDLPVIRLTAGEQREASLAIQTPANSPVSVGLYPVTIHVISQSQDTWRGEAKFNLRVSAYEQTIATPAEPTSPGATVRAPGVEAPGGRIGLILESAQFTAVPGETLTIPVVIANRGMHEDNFYLSVDGLPPSWVSVSSPALRLMPGEHGEILLYIQPPTGPAGRAGRHPFSIRASSQTNLEQMASVDVVLTVAAVSQFMADLTPRRIDAGQTVRLRIQNLGNFQDTYTVRFQNVDGQLEFVPEGVGPLQLMPGETTTLDFVVSARNPNLFGSPTRSAYSALVQSAGGETQGYNGEVLSRSLIPIWVIPVLALLCLASICGMGFLWNWNQNRLTRATRTAEAGLALVAEQTATAATATAVQLETEIALNTAIAIEGESAAQTATAAAFFAQQTSEAEATITADAAATEAALLVTATQAAVETATALAIAEAQTATAAASAIPTQTLTPSPPPPATATFTATVPAPTPTVIQLPVTGEQLIVFVSNRSGGQRLYLFRSSDGTLTPLTEGDGAVSQPAWSPDGTRLLFVSNRDGNNEIYLLTLDNGSQVNLTQHPADDRFPTWSPDGEQIAFTSDRDGNNEIYVMDVDGSDPVNITNSDSNDYKPAWYTEQGLLGDTSRILFTSDRDGNNEIYSMDPDGSDQVNLTEHPANDMLPAVPYQGGLVAFVSDRDGTLDIFTMQPDGDDQVNITNSPASDTWPVWSSDGSWIAFTSNRDGQREIYIMGAGGEELTNLTQSTAEEFDAAWR